MAWTRLSSRAEQRGHRSAARAAEGADALGVNLRARDQVVDSAHAVPRKVARDRFPMRVGCRLASPCSPVGPRRQRCSRIRTALLRRRCVLRVGILQALALANGVVREHRESVAREGGRHDEVAGLAAGRVAGRHDDSGEFRGTVIRQIEQRGDEELRLRFVQHLLDAEAVELRAAENLRVERRFLEVAAHQVKKFRAYFLLACYGPLRGS